MKQRGLQEGYESVARGRECYESVARGGEGYESVVRGAVGVTKVSREAGGLRRCRKGQRGLRTGHESSGSEQIVRGMRIVYERYMNEYCIFTFVTLPSVHMCLYLGLLRSHDQSLFDCTNFLAAVSM